eukprot:COSAG02_NODE_5212_length_4536_cov_11.181839_5_plen_203_part_00
MHQGGGDHREKRLTHGNAHSSQPSSKAEIVWAEAKTPDPARWWAKVRSDGLNVQTFARRRWTTVIQTLVVRRSPNITQEHLRKYQSLTYLTNSLIAIGAPTAVAIADLCEAQDKNDAQPWPQTTVDSVLKALRLAKQTSLASNAFVSGMIGAAFYCDSRVLAGHRVEGSTTTPGCTVDPDQGRAGQYPTRLLSRTPRGTKPD